jgi:hypothetical protein
MIRLTYYGIDLELRLKEKEERIKQLSGAISIFESSQTGEPIQEVLAFSNNPEEDDEPFKPMKMTRADFIMAQVDLDVIESHAS